MKRNLIRVIVPCIVLLFSCVPRDQFVRNDIQVRSYFYSVLNKTVFLGQSKLNQNTSLFSLDSDGNIKKIYTPRDLILTDLATDKTLVYLFGLLGEVGVVQCYDVKKRKKIWSLELGEVGLLNSPFTLLKSEIVFSTTSEKFYFLDKKSGEIIGKFSIPMMNINDTFTIKQYKGSLYVISSTRIFRITDNKILWDSQIKEKEHISEIPLFEFYKGQIYFIKNPEGEIAIIDTLSGMQIKKSLPSFGEIYEFSLRQDTIIFQVLGKTIVYSIDEDKILLDLDSENSIIVGNILLLINKNIVTGIALDTLEKAWGVKLEGEPIEVKASNNKEEILVVSTAGNLYIVDSKGVMKKYFIRDFEKYREQFLDFPVSYITEIFEGIMVLLILRSDPHNQTIFIIKR